MTTQGKRAGSRRGTRPPRSIQPRLLGQSLAITLLVVAWGYLVYAAIDFGSSARGGESEAWWFMALAASGAVACLFIGLMLVARLLRALGITRPPETTASQATPVDASPDAPGHRRAAR